MFSGACSTLVGRSIRSRVCQACRAFTTLPAGWPRAHPGLAAMDSPGKPPALRDGARLEPQYPAAPCPAAGGDRAGGAGREPGPGDRPAPGDRPRRRVLLRRRPRLEAAGATVFLLSMLLDRADGELARQRQRQRFSRFGLVSDLASDCISTMAAFVGLGLGAAPPFAAGLQAGLLLGLAVAAAVAAVFMQLGSPGGRAGPRVAVRPRRRHAGGAARDLVRRRRLDPAAGRAARPGGGDTGRGRDPAVQAHALPKLIARRGTGLQPSPVPWSVGQGAFTGGRCLRCAARSGGSPISPAAGPSPNAASLSRAGGATMIGRQSDRESPP